MSMTRADWVHHLRHEEYYDNQGLIDDSKLVKIYHEEFEKYQTEVETEIEKLKAKLYDQAEFQKELDDVTEKYHRTKSKLGLSEGFANALEKELDAARFKISNLSAALLVGSDLLLRAVTGGKAKTIEVHNFCKLVDELIPKK